MSLSGYEDGGIIDAKIMRGTSDTLFFPLLNPDGLEYYVDVDNLDLPWLSTDGTSTISYDLVSYDVAIGVYHSSIRVESSAINEYNLLITVEPEPNQAPIFVLDTKDDLF